MAPRSRAGVALGLRARPPRIGSDQWDLVLILFADGLRVALPVRIEELLPAFSPRRLQFGRADVPVGPALLEDGTQVLAQLFHRRAAEEPVAHVDLVDDQAGLEHERVRDHGIVGRIGVFGDVRSEEHTSELQSRQYLVCRLLLEKKNHTQISPYTFSSEDNSI